MNDTVKIPVQSVLNRMSKYVIMVSRNTSYTQDVITRSLVSNCANMVALIKLVVDGTDILNAEGEQRVINAAKATPEYKANVGAEFIQIVHDGKVIFGYVDN